MSEESSTGISSLKSVSDGATLHYIGTVFVNIAGFLLNLLLTRTLGASIYGIYAYGTMVITSLLTFANLGSETAVTRYLSGNRDDRAYQNQVLGVSYLTTLFISPIIAIVLFLAAPTINAYTLNEPLFTSALQLFAIALPFQALVRIVSSSFRALEMAIGKTVVMVVGPLLQLTFVSIAIFLGYSLLGITAAYAIACLMAFMTVFTYFLSRTNLRPSRGLSRGDAKEFYNYSVPITFSNASSFLFKRVDIFMVGIFLASAEVGIYNIAVLLAGVIAMPLTGINQLFPPVASRLHSNGSTDELETVYATVTRWSITGSLVIVLPIVVYRAEILSLFGPEFVAGTTVLALFAAAQLINAASGPANDLLTMTDHQYAVMMNHFSFGTLNVAMNYYFIQEFGLIGAALATAGVLASLSIVRVIEVWYFEGLFAYSRKLWKPLTAAVVALFVMYVVGLQLDGFVLLVAGSGVGVVAFFGCLYGLGLENQDVETANEYLGIFS